MKANRRAGQRPRTAERGVAAQQPARRRPYILFALFLALLGGLAYFFAQQFRKTSDWHRVEAALEQRDLEGANRQLKDFLDAYPNDPQALLIAAQTSRRQGKFDEAVDLLRARDRAAPGNSETQLERDLLRIQQGDLSTANALLSDCQDKPRSPRTTLTLEAIVEGYISRFWSYSARQAEIPVPEYAQAQGAVDLWLSQQPAPPAQARGQVWRGKLAALVRDYDASEAAFRAALAIDPGDLEGSEFLGLLLAQDAPQEAASLLERVYERNPDNEKVSFGLATIRRALGEPAQAVEIIDDLLDRHPYNASYLLERGRLELDQQRPEEAAVWLQRAVRVAPDHGPANLLLSICLEQMGRPAEAKHFRDRSRQTESRTSPAPA